MTRPPHAEPAHVAHLPPDEAPFGRDALPRMPPDFVVRAALGLRRAVLRLVDAATPAELVVFERAFGHARVALLGAAARWRLADVIGDGALTSEELAARVGASADALHRALRGLAYDGVFALRDGRWVNTRLSRALRAGGAMRMRHMVMYQASRSNQDAWQEIDSALRTGEGGFRAAHGASVWDWFDAHPHERETFAQAMMGLTAHSAGFVAGAYPFAEASTVCDVGGGRGTLLSEVLLRHPHLRGTLCENAGLEPAARALFEARGVSGRARFVAGSFFEAVPAGADVYTMKNVLHDWGDEASRRILATVRRAMAPGAKLLVVESLIERGDTGHPAALADLQMMMVCDDGRERSLGELRALFEASGFRLGRTWPATIDALTEAVAV